MHVADQRHGLDVVATLRAEGVTDHDVLLAGPAPRLRQGRRRARGRGSSWSLGEAYGAWIWPARPAGAGLGAALERLRTHAEASAELAAAAGCSPRTVELIRHQDAPRDADATGRAAPKLADEAN